MALSNVPNSTSPLNGIEDDLEFTTPFPSSKTLVLRSASPDHILRHVRKKSTKERRSRIARIQAKKKLKKVVSERRKKIRKNTKRLKKEEGGPARRPPSLRIFSTMIPMRGSVVVMMVH
jgi:hypothetical protein